MAANRKPGNPWNQFSKKKKPPSSIVKRTPKPDVKPSNALKPAPERPALPPAKPRNTTPKPAPKRLPAAGQSGGSKPPKGTTVPQRGGPARSAEQLAQERRSAASSRAAGSRLGNSAAKPPSTGTPVGAATKAATRAGNLARGVRTFASRAMGPLAVGTTAGSAYLDARKRGETQGRSVGQGVAAATGFAGGAAAGARVPGPPLVKGAAALIGGTIGSIGAVKAMQGTQEAAKRAGGENRPKPGNAQSRFAGARDANLNRINNDPRFAAPAPTQSGTQRLPSNNTPSRQARAGSAGTNTSTPRPIPSTNSRPAPAANAGMKNQDKNFRGNLFEKTFGYKPGNAPDQTRARQDKAANPSNFDTKSDTYQPQTKVDGSQYADKKPDMKKVNEYDRRKRRYYD